MTIHYNADGTRDVRLADGTWQQQRLGLNGWQPVELQDDNLRFFEGLVFAVTAVVAIGVMAAVVWSLMR